MGNSETADKPVLGWFCTYTPEEIILAAGFESRRILGRTGPTAKADAHLHPNLCAFVRACLSSGLEGEHAKLAGIIGIDSCDAMRRLFDVWRATFHPDYSHILAMPHVQTAEAVEFYRHELERLIRSLNQYFGLTISDADLLRGIHTMNETRTLLTRLYKLRRSSAPISGTEYYSILRDAMTEPKDRFNHWLKQSLEKSTSNETSVSSGVNIILAGGVLDDPWIVGVVEEAGGRVVADDLCCGGRYFEKLTSTQGEPLKAIADRYVLRAPCARMSETETRVQNLMELIEETHARGLIYYTVKFCDPHILDWAMISKELQSRGVRALRCETDYSISERERMRTRIEAFLEMLK
ncbi:MAG: 2-hydroxyacyl-CoA dehydratase [Candidatus Abyssobacteria bacterium SURF_17]|jgi:benzoyl-CoA reductase/2-hydroxyglutaryl-CoA dehydratase subunit BcrC/BadD/HgdB|uniref:2-hydroxyacyl-CoA dehydratase n=1 Tax=Candidatus Abyssobacteria bacterium SURF_17 TaxID=2093361 RepID=A0A419F2T8_9BACT|nr:MAG: 2-hydroxyacyl-CoA dehydratase [Candidatus Abyssubacteria bacterium SURF_17]